MFFTMINYVPDHPALFPPFFFSVSVLNKLGWNPYIIITKQVLEEVQQKNLIWNQIGNQKAENFFLNISLSQKFVYFKHFLTQNLENFLVQILQKYLKRQTIILPNISCDVHFSPRLGVSEQKWCISHDEWRGWRYTWIFPWIFQFPINI